jgi:hypothetical protein
MRNYTGLAVWGCLAGLLALEFIDFGFSPKTRTVNSGPNRSAPADPAPVPQMASKAAPAKAGALGKRGRENVPAPFSHIRDKRDGTLSFRQ